MTDEPDQDGGDGRPKFFNSVTGWIGGLTAVVLALAGLKAAAGQLDLFGSSKPAEAEQAASTEEETASDAEPATEQAAEAELPTSYTGIWDGKDVTLDYRNGVWIETTAEGTEDEQVVHYEQLSRTDAMTNAIDRNRNLYVRWPSGGGTLEESEDAITWTRSYEVTAA
jgi:hypothetical protein